MSTERQPNPQIVLNLSPWTLMIETQRTRIRNERNVHLSDNPTGQGLGTFLRTEKSSCRMTIHKVHLTHEKGGGFLIQVTEQGKRTSVTKRNLEAPLDIDGKALPIKPETYTMAKAEDFFARTLQMDRTKVRKLILTPLPEETDVGTVSNTTPALQEA